MRRAVICAALLVGAPAAAEVALSDVLSARGLDGFVTVDRLPQPDTPMLIEGQGVWEGTCMACHGGNKATGAPKITATNKWQPRIAQGLPTLIEHATQGFVGKTYTEMPARGGNPDLSDAEIAASVAFMVWASGGADEALAFIATNKE
ncbi:cytochrome c5 family protein [Donghicola sp. XS_ASV15]|uniref:c-type cytochrome n=1 Tax=Donghicola sp. XS_ASV15 TaxID=3241295 RepID=UPI0035156772